MRLYIVDYFIYKCLNLKIDNKLNNYLFNHKNRIKTIFSYIDQVYVLDSALIMNKKYIIV